MQTTGNKLRLSLELLLITAIIFGPVLYFTIFKTELSDYPSHMQYVLEYETDISRIPPNLLVRSLWQYLVLLVHQIPHIQLKAAAFVVTLASVGAAVLVIFPKVLGVLGRDGKSGWLVVLVSVGLVVVNPISLFVVLDGSFYLGYIGMNSFHNPTILLLKPLALLQLFYSFKVFSEQRVTPREIALAFVVSLLSGFAKPSFTICLLPALGVLVLVWLWKKQVLNWSMLVMGLGLPSALMLMPQFLLTYGTGADSSVIFSVLGVMRRYSDHLFPKLILSVLFPLVVLVVYRRGLFRDRRMLLTWLCFLFGIIYTYFLAEGGDRFRHGNFGWSGEIGMFLLFVMSTLYYLEQEWTRGLYRTLAQKLVVSTWLLHLAWGVAYLIYGIVSGVYI